MPANGAAAWKAIEHLGLVVLGFRALGFRVLGFRVLGFRVYGEGLLAACDASFPDHATVLASTTEKPTHIAHCY